MHSRKARIDRPGTASEANSHIRAQDHPSIQAWEPKRSRDSPQKADDRRREQGLTILLSRTGAGIFFLVLGALVLTLLDVLRRRGTAHFELREFAEFGELRHEMARAAESGRPIHIALGSGALGSGETIASLAGLQVLEGLVSAAAACDAAPIITVGDPTLVPLAQDTLRRAYERRGVLDLYDPTQVRFVAPAPLAYAAGAHPVGAPEDTTASVAAGAYGFEVSLIADGNTRREVVQWAGVDNAQAIGALYPATHRLAMGEELYALGAQVTERDTYSKSLVAEDVLRLVAVLAILGAVALAVFAG